MGKLLFLYFACLGAGCAACYKVGFMHGRLDTIHRLFSGEKDFKQFLEYRRQQTEDRHDA